MRRKTRRNRTYHRLLAKGHELQSNVLGRPLRDANSPKTLFVGFHLLETVQWNDPPQKTSLPKGSRASETTVKSHTIWRPRGFSVARKRRAGVASQLRTAALGSRTTVVWCEPCVNFGSRRCGIPGAVIIVRRRSHLEEARARDSRRPIGSPARQLRMARVELAIENVGSVNLPYRNHLRAL